MAVNTTHDSRLPGHGQEFIPLAQASDGANALQAQQIWLDSFTPDFVTAEPRPLCAFPQSAEYTGSGDLKDAANWRCKAPARKETGK